MERNRSKKAKAKGKPRQNPVLNDETHLALCPRIPPALSLIKKQREVRRFISLGAVANQTFTLSNGHTQFLVVTTVAGNSVPYVDSWRLKSITVWALAKSIAGTIENTSFTLTGIAGDVSSNMFNEPERVYNVDSASIDEYSHMKIKCGKRSPLGSWHFTTNVNPTGVLFQYSATGAGANVNGAIIMDLEFETVQNLVGLPLGFGALTSTTTLGTQGGQNINGFAIRGINSLG